MAAWKWVRKIEVDQERRVASCYMYIDQKVGRYTVTDVSQRNMRIIKVSGAATVVRPLMAAMRRH